MRRDCTECTAVAPSTVDVLLVIEGQEGLHIRPNWDLIIQAGVARGPVAGGPMRTGCPDGAWRNPEILEGLISQLISMPNIVRTLHSKPIIKDPRKTLLDSNLINLNLAPT